MICSLVRKLMEIIIIRLSIFLLNLDILNFSGFEPRIILELHTFFISKLSLCLSLSFSQLLPKLSLRFS